MRGEKNNGKFSLTLQGKRLFLYGRMGVESELIDWEQLDMMADGYTPDFVEIYREFLDQTPELLRVLEQHVAAGNVAGAQDDAHKIKGSSANFGFVGVSEPMSRIERQAKDEGNLEGAMERVLEARWSFERSGIEVREKRGI